MAQDLREQACWITLAFESGLNIRLINDILVAWCYQQKKSLQEFFAVNSSQWVDVCGLRLEAVQKLERAREKLVAQSFLVEQLANASISLLTIFDEEYPRLLKTALKRNQTPPVLFYSGDLSILQRQTIAIIGSRNAGEQSLTFTHDVARYLAGRGANVISGNARGVDRAAYEGAIDGNGHTTVVLPHGIRKLSGVKMRELLPKIDAGEVLLLSQFHPDAPWVVSRAMERNKVVTGLAQLVIVAESDTKGGTWEGANGALAQKRLLYVCQMNVPSLPGNEALLKRGARSLPWPADNLADELAPLLDAGQEVQRRQMGASLPPGQLSLLAISNQ
ncbi:MAG TPA: DNA-processing protein DprA [Ktedonobacteraceae bacterium]|jgi:DNA processing protein|nr:DNA-processing protein DprA [Ktedonobacteraceae bacterium]